MKKIISLILLTLSFHAFSQSADYVCDVQNYRVEINLRTDTSTHMWLTDRSDQRTIAQAYAGSIETDHAYSIYHFYPGNADEAKLTFRTQDAVNFPGRIYGYIETKARGFLLNDYLTCSKRQ
jgi:predicted RecB family nuclease